VVNSVVVGLTHNVQVVDRVVHLIAVDVVNVLVRRQLSLQRAGHVVADPVLVDLDLVESTSAEKTASEFCLQAERRSALYNQFSGLLAEKANRAIRLKASEPAQRAGGNSLLGSDLIDGVDLGGERFNLRCVVVFHKSRLTPSLPTFKRNRQGISR